MQLRQLSYFVGVAESGSFSRAAAVLSVAQPALSRQVAELERELGVALLVRNGRGVVLTDPGVKFLGRAKLILEDAERATQEARASKGRPMGVVALGIAPSIGSVLTAPLVSRIRELYPEIHIQLNEAYSGNLHEWLLSGRLDAGILYIPKSVSAANVTRLVTEQLYFIGRTDELRKHFGKAVQLRLETALKLPLILPARPHTIRGLLDQAAARKQLDLTLSLEVNGFLAIRDLVSAGLGFTILPASNFLKEIASGLLGGLTITDPSLTQAAGVMLSPHHAPSLAVKAVAKTVREVARDLISCGRWPEKLVDSDRRPAP
jgi:LysR family transcriptional regulator, nitrogen assimilation regulatory protein